MKSFLNAIPAVIAAASLSACSAAATMTVAKPKTEAISSTSSVALQVTSTPDAESEEVVQKLRSALFGHLVSDGIFKQVVTVAEPADYEMNVTVDHVRTVSQGARIFLGVLAGENKLTAHCDVTNATSNTEVARFDVVGESASHPLSSENDMDDAVSKVVEKIVAELR